MITPQTERYLAACRRLDLAREQSPRKHRRMSMLKYAVRILGGEAMEAVEERDRELDRNIDSLKEGIRLAFTSPNTTHA